MKHKSARECAKLYFENYLDLGIKKIVKDASTLKLKSGLRGKIMTMDRKRVCAKGGAVTLVCNENVQMVSAQEGVDKFVADKFSRLVDVTEGAKELNFIKGLLDERRESR